MAFEAGFRGSYICEQMATTRDILRVPVRLIVDGDTARFTRPLLDLDGGRIGVEVARGFISRHGELGYNPAGACSETSLMVIIVAGLRRPAAR
jgi:hypothetical protein